MFSISGWSGALWRKSWTYPSCARKAWALLGDASPASLPFLLGRGEERRAGAETDVTASAVWIELWWKNRCKYELCICDRGRTLQTIKWEAYIIKLIICLRNDVHATTSFHRRTGGYHRLWKISVCSTFDRQCLGNDQASADKDTVLIRTVSAHIWQLSTNTVLRGVARTKRRSIRWTRTDSIDRRWPHVRKQSASCKHFHKNFTSQKHQCVISHLKCIR